MQTFLEVNFISARNLKTPSILVCELLRFLYYSDFNAIFINSLIIQKLFEISDSKFVQIFIRISCTFIQNFKAAYGIVREIFIFF